MDILTDIESRMEKIRGIFQYALSVSIDEADLDLLDAALKATENEFRSIGYEAAAMQMALKDITTGETSFKHWQLFINGPGQKHLTQSHIGLGWAMAQQQIPVLPFVSMLDPLMQCRVMDGYGYYEGIFRKRRSIGEKMISEKFEDKFLHGFDMGLGRSIWYICKADCEKIAETVASFPFSRQRDIWRGIGAACSYVGGFDENLLHQLSAASTIHSAQLAIGASLVARSRTEAGSYTRYVDMACRVWCKCSSEEAYNVTVKTEPSPVNKLKDPCDTWVKNIEEVFVAAKVNNDLTPDPSPKERGDNPKKHYGNDLNILFDD